jgi:hypothetical protein
LTPKSQNLILQIVMKSLKLLAVILAGFWVAACVTTSSTRTTTPPSGAPQQTQTESSQTRQAPEQPSSTQQSSQGTAQSKQEPSSEQSPASQSAPQEASRDKQKQTSESGPAESQETDNHQRPQASEKSQSGQTAAEPAAKDQQQQASEQPQSGQPASGATDTPDTGTARQVPAGAPGTPSRASEQRTPGSRPAPAETADSKLAEARENLRISEATEKRIASELEQLKRSGSASAETIKNYETYHESVKEMVAENRKIVEQMEAAQSRHSSGATASGAAGGGQTGNLHDPRIPEEETTGEVAALDRQLNASLNQFDAKLLKEMDEIRDGSAEKMRDLAQEAAEAAKRLREEGVDVDTSGSESSQGSEDDDAGGREQRQAEPGAEDSRSASTDASRPGGKGSGGADQGRASYEDDDIVARQLREAAENETDPELKEKLWKEYDEYKKNQQ